MNGRGVKMFPSKHGVFAREYHSILRNTMKWEGKKLPYLAIKLAAIRTRNLKAN